MQETTSRAVTVLLAGTATAGVLAAAPGASAAPAATARPAQCSADFFTVDTGNVLRDYGVSGGAVRLDETHARLPFRPRLMAMATQVGDAAAYSKYFVAVTPGGELRWVDAHAYTDRSKQRRHTVTTRHLAGGWQHLSNLAVVTTSTPSDDIAGLRVYGTSRDGSLHLFTFDAKFRQTGHQVVMRGLGGTVSLNSSATADQPRGTDKLLATTRSGSLQEIDVTHARQAVATRTVLQRTGWAGTQGLGSTYCTAGNSYVRGYLRAETSGRLSLYSDAHLYDRKGNDIHSIGAVRGHYLGRVITGGL